MLLDNVPEALASRCSDIEAAISVKQFSLAFNLLKKLLEEEPNFKLARDRLIEILPEVQLSITDGRNEADRQIIILTFQRTICSLMKPSDLIQFTEEAIQKGELQKAENSIKLALGIYSVTPHIINFKLACIKFLQCEFQQAFDIFYQMSQREKESNNIKSVCGEMANAAEMLQYSGDFDRAIHFYDIAIEEARAADLPPNCITYALRGIAHWYNNNTAKAAEDMHASIANQGEGACLFNNGSFYLDVLKGLVNHQYDETIQLFQQRINALAFDEPELTQVRIWMGNFYELKQDYSLAVEAHNTVLHKMPGHPYCMHAIERLNALQAAKEAPVQEPVENKMPSTASASASPPSASSVANFLYFLNSLNSVKRPAPKLEEGEEEDLVRKRRRH